MTSQNGADLTNFYNHVRKEGRLRTPDHAQRWTRAVLYTLGLNLDGKTKKQLAKVLPQPLSEQLKRPFWLLHFRNTKVSKRDFCKMVANRSGHTDAQFAQFPVKAVFGGMKQLIDSQTSRRVAESLSPEVSDIWQQA